MNLTNKGYTLIHNSTIDSAVASNEGRFELTAAPVNSWDLTNKSDGEASIHDITVKSITAVNSGELKAVINEGDDQAKIKITLKNNGSKAWEKGDTVLCYNRQSKISGEDNYLNPQN